MSTLEGTWHYQSYLIQPTPSEEAAPPSNDVSVTTHKWAMGTLTVRPDSNPGVSGVLEFAPGVTLTVRGHIIPASDSSSAILVATGEGPAKGPLQGAMNWITGTVIEADGRESIHGSVLGVRGPNADPNNTGGGAPQNTVGAFVLARPIEGLPPASPGVAHENAGP
jgi:hypothetical protein